MSFLSYNMKQQQHIQFLEPLLHIPTRVLTHQLAKWAMENPMDRGAWWATVHGVRKSWTWLSMLTHTLNN